MYVPLHFIYLAVRHSYGDLIEVDPFGMASKMHYLKVCIKFICYHR